MDEYGKKLEDRMHKKSKASYHPFDDMMAWEDGKLNEKGTKRLFQHLVDTNQAFHLQGMYGRAANDMLESGFIKQPHHKGVGHTDAYGNPMEHYYKKFDKHTGGHVSDKTWSQ